MKRILSFLCTLAALLAVSCDNPDIQPPTSEPDTPPVVEEPDKYQQIIVTFDVPSNVELRPNSKLVIRFKVESSLPATVEVDAKGGVTADIFEQSEYGVYDLAITAGEKLDPICIIDVIVYNERETVIRTLEIRTPGQQEPENPDPENPDPEIPDPDIPETEVLHIFDTSSYAVGKEGGEVTLVYISNVDCNVEFLDGADAWISLVPDTRGIETHYLSIYVKPNDGGFRIGRLRLTTKSGSSAIEYTIRQISVNGEDEILENATENNHIYIDSNEQVVELAYRANVECKAIIENGSDTWLSIMPGSKAADSNIIYIKATENKSTTNSRTGSVVIESLYGFGRIDFHINQSALIPDEFDWTSMPDDEIWYVTRRQGEDNLGLGSYISNSYSGGLGKLKFSEPLTSISDMNINSEVTQLYLPDKVENMTNVTIMNSNLTLLKLPANLKTMQFCNIFDNFQLRKIAGELATEDGRAAVIDDRMVLFAPAGIAEYTVPDGVKLIDKKVFYNNKELKKLVLPEGVEELREMAISESAIEELTLPSTLKTIDLYGLSCLPELNRIDGASDMITDDGMAVVVEDFPSVGCKSLLLYKNGSTASEYSIPEGVTDLYPQAFYRAESLKEVNIPASVMTVNGYSGFYQTYLEKISGPNVLEDGRSLVIDGRLEYVAPAGLREYTTPAGVKVLSSYALADKPELETVVVSDDVETVEGFGYLLWLDPNLKNVTLSAQLKTLGYDPFGTGKDVISENVENIHIRSKYPPTVAYNNPLDMNYLPKATIYVQEDQVNRYKSSPSWRIYADKIRPYDYGDLSRFDPEYYMTEDYSKDGTVVTLQTASKGNGIDIVLMGDAYSDREIEDGTYRNDMEFLAEHLFDEEPFKTYKDFFNIYYVTVVSDYEGYEYGASALAGQFGEGTRVGGNDAEAIRYALKALPEERMDDAMIVVSMNSDRYAGTCYLRLPEHRNDYASGLTISYFPRSTDKALFAGLLHHEANGHGFAKLGDEYFYERNGRIPSSVIETETNQHNIYGWWKNIDYVSDPEEVRWAHFLADERYSYDGLGVYEGASTYIYGAYRPTYTSIMDENHGGFNAPSREAIYYRIHKLAYGPDWEYDYEKFVEYDSINRKTAPQKSVPMSRSMRNYVEKVNVPTTPPVVIPQTWRDAK